MTLTIAKNIIHIEMEIAPENPTLDVDTTAGALQEFSFTAFTCIYTNTPHLPRILPTDDSPADTAYTSWVVGAPLDKVVSFKVSKSRIHQDVAEALEGLPEEAHSTATSLALQAFKALSEYEENPGDLESWFQPVN